MPNASLQTVIRACLANSAVERRWSPRQWQVCRHILDCRTAALGGFALRCDACDDRPLLFHACRDRHCPRCQRRETDDWCERQRAAVLPVTYHHRVFTLPHLLDGLVEIHAQELYDLLFATVWATLSAFGADPKRLDGRMGMTAVLHTWGQTLVRHVHRHCLVPGGALAKDGTWHPAKSTYLFPVRALSRRFRGGFVSRVRQAFTAGKLARVTDGRAVDRTLDALMKTEWVVYSQPCLSRTETVVDYLGRYSHRIALYDSRIRDFDGTTATLSYQDYRDGDRRQVMTLTGEELVRRFLLHVLPTGFVRVRHFGLLANRCRAKRLTQIRTALAVRATLPSAATPGPAAPFAGFPCPKCRRGTRRIVGHLAPPPRFARHPTNGGSG